jgi:hypothetical protein
VPSGRFQPKRFATIACCHGSRRNGLPAHFALDVRQALGEEVDRELRGGLVERAVAGVANGS